MTALLAAPTTVGSLLGAHRPEELAPVLRRAGVSARALAGVPRLPRGAERVLDDRVAGVLHGLLQVDLGELVVAGWAERPELADAVLRSGFARLGAQVRLADHRTTSTHRPAVDVLAGGAPVGALRFELVVALRLRRAVAVVRGGLLVEVPAGRLTADAVLTLHGRELLRGTGRGPVGALLRLGDGLLVPGPPARPDRPGGPGDPGDRAAVLRLPLRTGPDATP